MSTTLWASLNDGTAPGSKAKPTAGLRAVAILVLLTVLVSGCQNVPDAPSTGSVATQVLTCRSHHHGVTAGSPKAGS